MGEITLSSVDEASSSAMPTVYLDPRDLENMSLDFSPLPGGATQLTVRFPQQFGQAFELEPMIRRTLMDLLSQTRDNLTPAEQADLRVEEEEAGKLDVDADDNDDRRCVVCLQKQRAKFFLPCRHMVTCHRCTVIVRRTRCPVCRQQIDEVKGIQDAKLED